MHYAPIPWGAHVSARWVWQSPAEGMLAEDAAGHAMSAPACGGASLGAGQSSPRAKAMVSDLLQPNCPASSATTLQGTTAAWADLAEGGFSKPRKEGAALLSEVCREMREAFERRVAEGTVTAALLCARPLQSPVPLWELQASDHIEGNALHFAASRQLPSAALALLACQDFSPLVPRARERDGSTALHLAAAEGQEEVVKALLDRTDMASFIAATDKDGFTALHGAAFRGHMPCVHLLLSCADFGPELASACGVFDIPRPPGHWAREAADLYDMSTALHCAAAGGHAELCRDLLATCPAVADKANRMAATALHMAARGNHVATCEALLQSPSFRAVNARDARGFTALHWAAQQVMGDICAAIIKREDFTAVESRDLRGRTAANIAEEMRHPEIQHVILSRGV